MLILLYGEDTYRSSQKLASIIAEYKQKKKGLNFKVFDAETGDGNEFFSSTRQTSIFPEKKFVIVKGAFENKAFKEQLLKNAKKLLISDDVTAFYQAGKILKGDKLFQYFAKNGEVQEFSPLEPSRLDAWAKAEVARYGFSIDRDALVRLNASVGNDCWRLSNEIQKLVNFCSNRGKTIQLADVIKLVKPRIETDIFKTIDALGQKNKKLALRLIHDHLEKGDSHFYILSMINYQFRNLLMVKSLEAAGGHTDPAKKLEMHPFVLRKTMQLAEKFSLAELKNIYKKIFAIDLDLKTGRLVPDIALDMLIAEI